MKNASVILSPAVAASLTLSILFLLNRHRRSNVHLLYLSFTKVVVAFLALHFTFHSFTNHASNQAAFDFSSPLAAKYQRTPYLNDAEAIEDKDKVFEFKDVKPSEPGSTSPFSSLWQSFQPQESHQLT